MKKKTPEKNSPQKFVGPYVPYASYQPYASYVLAITVTARQSISVVDTLIVDVDRFPQAKVGPYVPYASYQPYASYLS